MIRSARLLRFEANLDAITDNPQGIAPDRRDGRFAQDAAVPNIERSTV